MHLDPGAGPVALGLEVHRTVGHLQALLRLGRGAHGLDLGVADHREELALHLPILRAGAGRQLDLDHVDDRVLEIEPVLRVQRQADVSNALLDLGLGVVAGAVVVEVARLHRPEPAVPECAERATQAHAGIQKPGLPPQVLEPVAGRGAGEVDPALDVLVCDLGEGLGTHATLAQAEALELGALIGDDGGEGPGLALEVILEPDQVVVVGGVDRCLLAQGSEALVLAAHDGHNLEPCEVPPLVRLVGPGVTRHPQRGQHQGRAALAPHVVQVVQEGERHHALAHAGLGEDRRARHVGQVLHRQAVVGAGGEGLTHHRPGGGSAQAPTRRTRLQSRGRGWA